MKKKPNFDGLILAQSSFLCFFEVYPLEWWWYDQENKQNPDRRNGKHFDKKIPFLIFGQIQFGDFMYDRIKINRAGRNCRYHVPLGGPGDP